ncbi:MAG: PAS domain S-box protein [Nitrospirota bacterium]|nr:PAS domain S-box protein [Nitrospirota bacterium]
MMRDEDRTREQLIEELSELRRKLRDAESQNVENRLAIERLFSFKKVVDTMQIGITIADLNGNILYVNPADLDIHGYTPEELKDKKAGTFAPEQIRKPLTAEQIASMKRWKRESINMRKDGQVFPVHLMSDVIKAPDGQPVGVVTTCEDISERKKLEKEIREKIRELEVYYEATVHRELRMKELKKEIKKLKSELSPVSGDPDQCIDQDLLTNPAVKEM